MRDLVKEGMALKEEEIRSKLTYKEVEEKIEEIVDQEVENICKRLIGQE